MKIRKPQAALLGISILLAFVPLFGACTDTASADGGISGSLPEQTSASVVTTSGNSAIPAAPDRTAELYGSVKKIVGNEVTLVLAEQTTTDAVVLTEAEKAKKKEELQALSVEERQKLKASQIVYTGEETVVIIPVGTPITAGGTSGGTVSTLTEKALADIKTGLFLKIWTSEGGDGSEWLASYTRVLQAP